MIIPLLDGVDLDRAVVTADALHCQRATADYCTGAARTSSCRPRTTSPACPAPSTPCPGTTSRSPTPPPTAATAGSPPAPSRILPAPGDLPFPHASQAYLIERHITALNGQPLSDIAALGVTSLDTTRASPQAIADLVRGQWAIESLHWLRDTLYREDNSTVRTRSGPRAMATLRNLAVGALHLAGRHDTTEATRWASRNMDRPFNILGLMS
jgi:predicted transposase YbfD/YdcC